MRKREPTTIPPRKAVIFRRVEEECWRLAGLAKAQYFKDGRKMRFSYWNTFDIERATENSIWVEEYKVVTEQEATELCQPQA